MSLSRRSFLAASAAAVATPAFAALPASGNVDAVIIGAGAAGIAAARRLAAANKRIAVIEAADRIGGRCITDTGIFGVPVDLGAHWIHMPDINPVAKLAPQSGLDVYRAPPGQKLRIGPRYGRESEQEDFLSALVRANRAIGDAARGRADMPCTKALPQDLGEWRSTVEFVLGPFSCGKDLGDVSAMDFARSSERDVDAFCRQGFGALLAKLGDGIPVRLNTPAKRVNWGKSLEVVTDKGSFDTRTIIVTVSTNVLTAETIRFFPDLPKRQLDAAAKLSLGSYDHIVLEMPGNPLELRRDDMVFEKSDSNRTAAMLVNAAGSTLCMIEVGGRFGRELSAQGAPAMVAFARDWLGRLYGADIEKAIKRSHATQWNKAPHALGAFSAAAVGSSSARRILMEPLRDRIFFAGEAVHETLWGTVGGAWESGERAADAAIKMLGKKTIMKRMR